MRFHFTYILICIFSCIYSQGVSTKIDVQAKGISSLMSDINPNIKIGTNFNIKIFSVVG
jgi:hypothetical protein